MFKLNSPPLSAAIPKLFCFLFFGYSFLFTSCSSFSVNSSEDSAWTAEKMKPKGTIAIVSVSAEKAGDRLSLEKEITDLLPLLFSEESYLVIADPGAAGFRAEVNVREREYADGWQTKRSLSVEVRLWAAGARTPFPLSAGRSLAQGRQSLASSQTLGKMLRKAVQNAAAGLPGDSPEARGGGTAEDLQ